MFLYHGTSERHLAKILAEGLHPRGNRQSHWEKYPSLANHVYLTNSYPFYFGIQSTDPESMERACVFEIDTSLLDAKKFYPDEDFVSQDMERRIGRHRTNLKQLHERAIKSLDIHKDRWQESLDGLGTCSYRGVIPPAAITRYCLYEWRNGSVSQHLYVNVRLNVYHHEVRKSYHHELLEWMFDGDGDEGDSRQSIEVCDVRHLSNAALKAAA